MDETASGSDRTDSSTQYVPLPSRATIPPGASADTSYTASAASMPERFGRYRIVHCLGQGAMGAVYLALDTQLDRQIALKIPKFTRDDDGELIERFYREARAAATLRHANLCPVYDVGEIDGVHYLSMAFIEGRPLSEVLAKNGRPPQGDAVAVVLKLAKALDAAHTRGVIHRDLKPANIMIDPQNEPILMDFGLARRMNKEDSRLTQCGLVMGSPAYMSPEQVEGDVERMGPTCDIYSLGIVFYELLTGRVPFQGSIAAVMGQIITAEPKPPAALQPDVDPVLDAVCLKMIAKRSEERFASMRDVVAALEGYLAGRPIHVAIPNRDSATSSTAAQSGRALADRDRPHGVVIAPWMIWTAVGVVAIGFGVTWKLISITLLQQQSMNGELRLDAPAQAAFDDGTAKVVLNGKELTEEQLNEPIPFPAGGSKIDVVQDGKVIQRIEVPDDKDEKKYLRRTRNGLFATEPQRIVAEWVLSVRGKVNFGVGLIAEVESIPRGKLQIEEIDLSGSDVADIPRLQMLEIRRLTSLKRLVLTNTRVPRRQIDVLKKALPECKIESTVEN